jgi:rRNA processing protein Gar1
MDVVVVGLTVEVVVVVDEVVVDEDDVVEATDSTVNEVFGPLVRPFICILQ